MYFENGLWGGGVLSTEVGKFTTHTDSKRKLSFADLVNTFESKINSSIVREKNIKINI
jgi:hypothetical protein